MVTIDEQIRFIEDEKEASFEMSTQNESLSMTSQFLKDYRFYDAVLSNLKLIKRNGGTLQKECDYCKQMFDSKNKSQVFCSAKCRISNFRAKEKIRKFNNQVFEILCSKEKEPRFATAVLIVPVKECPFEVEYKGEIYKGKTTPQILKKLKQIEL